MKFIFSFLLYLILLSPTYADIATTGTPGMDYTLVNLCQIDQTDPNADLAALCNHRPGCYWSNDYSSCEECSRYTYSGSDQTECYRCVTEQAAQEAEAAYELNQTYTFLANQWVIQQPTPHSIFSGGQQGQASCPWICEEHYYRGGVGNNECKPCENPFTHSDEGYACGTTGLTYNSDENLLCDVGYHVVKNETNHTVTCSNCVNNATDTPNGCECNVGYYGDGTSNCTACPNGTTSTPASDTTSIRVNLTLSDCYMPRTVKFCDKNGQNCMQLIP